MTYFPFFIFHLRFVIWLPRRFRRSKEPRVSAGNSKSQMENKKSKIICIFPLSFRYAIVSLRITFASLIIGR